MDNFDLNLLRVFDVLYRHGHLGKAADELHLSQPALSYSLKRLRLELGDALFVKTRHGMQPTPRAMQLAPVVQITLAEIREHVLRTPRFEPNKVRRVFTIAMSDIGEMLVLPPLLRYLASAAPGIDVRAVAIQHKDLMSELQRSMVDLVLGFRPDLIGDDVFQQRLFRHGFVCLVRSGHPTVQGQLTREQFRLLPHAVIQAEGRSQVIVEKYLKEHGIQRREMLHSPHFLSIPMVIASTDLIVTVPAAVGVIFSRLMDIQVLEPPYPIPKFDLKQYWHRCQNDDPGNQWLRGVMLNLIGEFNITNEGPT